MDKNLIQFFRSQSPSLFGIFFVFLLLALGINSCSYHRVHVVDLTCEYLHNPLGIDVQQPRLGWRVVSDRSGAKQIAYHILVASSKEKLDRNIGDRWDSGRIESNQSAHLIYGGQPLHSRERCWWKVRIWNERGEASDWSDVATWEMALEYSDWQGKWIGIEETDGPETSAQNPALYFRKGFHLIDAGKKARAYISGLGYYELYINGKKVGDHVLSPNYTNYDRRQSRHLGEPRVGNMGMRALYETYDISPYLRSGDNVVAVCLGAGWYFQNEREEDIPYSYDTPRFILQLEIDGPNGRTTVISDDSWKTALGPIVHNGVYSGEIYDARREMPGWNDVGFNDSTWRPVTLVRAPEGRLMAQMSAPDRVIATIKPVALHGDGQGIVRYDFGQMFSGWVRLRVQGTSGSKMTLKFMEDSGPNYGQTDVYILKGGGQETWEPRFTWHAFRYVDIIDPPFPMRPENLEGVVVNTDADTVGDFSCSNGLFNRILQNYKWTQPGNLHGGVPSDCPHRERRGYTGDGQISAVAAMYNFNMAAFYTKWLNDIADAQNHVSGYVPNTAPYQGGGGGVAWGSAYVIIPWDMYLFYGDRRILERHYDGMKKWIDYLAANRDADGIIIEPGLGVWVPPEETKVPPSLVSTAYFYHDLILMSKIAGVLGKNQDAAHFDDLAEHTKKAFHQKYYNPDTKSYSIGYQGANVFPLGFGMVPDDVRDDVFSSLVRNIEERTKGHFDTGMMATPLLLEVLTRYGRIDLAYTLMNQRDFPSFGYEIENGATTIWENWPGDASHSHPMFGSVCAWFYAALAGIEPDTTAPGFKRFIVRPRPVGGLQFARASYESLYGRIVSAWEIKKGDFRLRVVVPPNSTATVYIPALEEKSVRVHGPATLVRATGHVAEYRMEAGTCVFVSKDIRNLIRMPMLSAPTITPLDTLAFVPDAVTVRIVNNNTDAEVRYTTDGSKPTKASSRYRGPFEVRQSCIVKARAFYGNRQPGPIAESTISFIDPAVNGVNYDYYPGSWTRLPNFDSLRPQKSGVVHNIGLEEILAHTEKFGVVFTTDIDIPRDGTYTFYLVSNDGSRLLLDRKLIVDNDGGHGALEKSGQVRLSAGGHALRIDYFQLGGGMYLRLFLSGPGMKKQRVPAAMLFAHGAR